MRSRKKLSCGSGKPEASCGVKTRMASDHGAVSRQTLVFLCLDTFDVFLFPPYPAALP